MIYLVKLDEFSEDRQFLLDGPDEADIHKLWKEFVGQFLPSPEFGDGKFWGYDQHEWAKRFHESTNRPEVLAQEKDAIEYAQRVNFGPAYEAWTRMYLEQRRNLCQELTGHPPQNDRDIELEYLFMQNLKKRHGFQEVPYREVPVYDP